MKSSLAELQPVISQAVMTADAAFDGVSTDSRNVAAGSLFVALRGERFDAHEFLAEVAARSAAAVVAERVPEGFPLPALLVPDSRRALGEIAAAWRRRFALPLIGVTGSNGKTTVKEMIASVLAAAFGADCMLATRGNLNNEIGLPLTLFRLAAGQQAAVVEMGMNHPGEIATLAAIAQPVVALVNNAQREHQEFMESVEAVARENGAVLRALSPDGTAVFPADDVYAPLWRSYAAEAGCRVLSFGLSDAADVRATYQPDEFGSSMQVHAGDVVFAVELAAAGEHNVRNALAAAACTLAIGIAPEIVARGLEAFAPVSGRLQRKRATVGALVIDDTYNANPDSVRAAIDVLASAPAPRLLVLGDMGEVGNEGPAFHREIGAYAKSRGIDRLLTLGALAADASAAFGTGAGHCDNIESLYRIVDAEVGAAGTVLVKGSRFMKMERVVRHLTEASVAKDNEGQETH